VGGLTLAKRERERSTRKQAATMSVVTVATDQVGVSASDRPSSAVIPASAACRCCSSSSSRSPDRRLAAPLAQQLPAAAALLAAPADDAAAWPSLGQHWSEGARTPLPLPLPLME